MFLKQSGVVYWITGLSGAGKTTVGRLLWERLCAQPAHAVFLDGDELRAVFGIQDGYAREDRLQLAMQYARLCKLISDQGTHVVIATISLFREVHEWNRRNLPNYKEVYLQVSETVLRARDTRGLYNRGDVVGTGIAFDVPENADIVMDNDGRVSPKDLERAIWEQLA